MSVTRFVFTSINATGYSTASSNARYITIASAIAAAVAGDTINIAPGIYKENVAVNKSLTIVGAQADIRAYVDGGAARSGSESVIAGHASNGGNCFTITANDVTINGVKCELPNNQTGQTATIRDAFNIQSPTNATVGTEVTRSNVIIKNNVIISNATAAQRQSLVLGESTANAQQVGKAKMSNIQFSNNYIDFSITANTSCRGIIFNSQYADLAYENVEISTNYIKHTSASANSPLASYYGAPTTRPLYYNGLKIIGNTINAPNSTGIRGLFDMNATSIISGNTIVAKVGLWVNFRETGGQIIDNTITTSTQVANNGVAIQIANGQYSNTAGAIATITGNTLINSNGSNNKYIQLEIAGFNVESIISSNTFTSSPVTSSLAGSFVKNGQTIQFTSIIFFSSFATASATVQQAAAAVIAAAGPTSSDTIITLIENANTAFKAPGGSLVEKAAVAAAVENLSEIVLDVAKTAELRSTLKPANVSAAIENKTITISPAKSVTVGAETIRYIMKGIDEESSSVYKYTPMIPDVWYTLLLSTEVNGAGVPTPPVGATLSQLKYVNDKLYFRSDSNSSSAGNEIKLDDEYHIRRATKYNFKVFAIGSTMDGLNGTLPCIPAGQRILTAAGWRAVEDLKDGDLVITDSGAAVPADIYSSTITTDSNTAPINIPVKGGNGFVRLSPNHAVRLNKSIWQFPCHLLKSRAGVTQDAPGQKVTYYHIALPNYLRDNLVLEGGIVAESYGVPFMKANATLKGTKIYTYNARLDGFTRVSYGVVASKKA
jgi:hypothetical protein